MKKRSMLAIASLATGFVVAAVTPSHALGEGLSNLSVGDTLDTIDQTIADESLQIDRDVLGGGRSDTDDDKQGQKTEGGKGQKTEGGKGQKTEGGKGQKAAGKPGNKAGGDKGGKAASGKAASGKGHKAGSSKAGKGH
ncbi:hypothetical protein ACIHCM_13990 [Streptomyces sp. NPDC052023]|uniref:hypothetical protein n=1 Tax=Streptomyces sp. NPDC052023 TaxID=3365681 RepID=UPI0037CFB615